MIEKWVKADGGSDFGTGEKTDPWQHIQFAVLWFADPNNRPTTEPARVHVMLHGDYVENIVMLGPNFSNITIQGEIAGRVAEPIDPQFCEQRPRVVANHATDPVFQIKEAKKVRITNLQITGGSCGIDTSNATDIKIKSCCIHDNTQTNPSDDGAGFALRNYTDAIVASCRIWSNQNPGFRAYGGGGYISQCVRVKILDSHFFNNSAEDAGGGLCIRDSRYVKIADTCEFGSPSRLGQPDSGPNKAGGGGAVYVENSTHVRSEENVFRANEAKYNGGAVYLYNARMVIQGDKLIENKAKEDGGAVYAIDGRLVIRDALIDNNEAGGTGGGIWARIDRLELEPQTIVSNNKAKEQGGGLYAQSTSVTVTECKFDKNTSDKKGGGIAASSYGNDTLLIRETSVSNNTADSGGGIYVGRLKLRIIESHFTDNSARQGDGGGLDLIYLASLRMINSELLRNTAPSGGGARLFHCNWGTIRASKISDNSDGGLLFEQCQKKDLTVKGNAFNRNKSAAAGRDMLFSVCDMDGQTEAQISNENKVGGLPDVKIDP